MTPFIVFAGFGAALIVLIAISYRLRSDGRWHPSGNRMKRYINGRWEDRPMTEEERREWIIDSAI